MKASFGALTVAALILGSTTTSHATTINLGASTQNYTLYGQGSVSPGVGSFTNQQGAEVYDAVHNTTTDTLSGIISGSSDPTLASGTYSLVTSYNGVGIGAGGQQVQANSNPLNLQYFYYNYLDPSVDMTLHLTTATGETVIPLVTDGNFTVDNFSFAFTSAECTGVQDCTQNNVGLTPGASQFGPVTTFVDFTAAVSAAPEPATWLLLLLAIGGTGLVLRRANARNGAMAC